MGYLSLILAQFTFKFLIIYYIQYHLIKPKSCFKIEYNKLVQQQVIVV